MILLLTPPVVGVTVKRFVLHTAVVSLAMVGFGFTVTVTVKVAPGQAPDAPEVGVTVYTTV